MKRKFLGLVLSGGAARGLVHIGILKGFEQEKIRIDVIGGASMGGIISILYATKLSWEYVYDKVVQAKEEGLFKKLGFDVFSNEEKNIFKKFQDAVKEKIILAKAFLNDGILPLEELKESLEKFLDIKSFEELKIPVYVSALELTEGKYVYFNKGALVDAIISTSAIPGYLPPLRKNGKIYVDGGAFSNIPVIFMKELFNPKVIIASALDRELDKKENLKGGYEFTIRISHIMKNKNENEEIKYADIVIEHDIKDISWADFHEIDKFLQRGYEKFIENKNKIKNLIRKRKIFFFLR